MKKNAILITLVSFLILGCDDPVTITFKNLVRGANPTELVGDYVMHWEEDSAVQEVIYTFSYLGKRQYLLTDMSEDTIFMGRIVRKKGDYYLSNAPDEKGYWDITSFRLNEDSIYNFWRAFAWGNDEDFIIENGFFKKYEKEVIDEREYYYMNNRQKETVKAFQAMNDEAGGIYFKKIEEIAEDGQEVALTETQSENELDSEVEFRLDIYPNPFVEKLTLELTNATEGKVSLYHLSGQLAMEAEFSGTHFDWNLAELAAGVYAIRVVDQNGNLLKGGKVIKR